MARGNRRRNENHRKSKRSDKTVFRKRNRKKSASVGHTKKRDVNRVQQEVFKRSSEENENVSKRYRIDARDESSEEEVFDVQDNLKQLLSTFKGTGKFKKKVVESDDSDEETNSKDSDGEASFGVSDNESGGIEAQDMTDNENDVVGDETEDLQDASQDDPDDLSDPFMTHLQYDLSPELLEAVSANPPSTTSHQENWPGIGQFIVQLPVNTEVNRATSSNTSALQKVTVEEDTVFTKPGTVPKRIENVDWGKLFVRSQIHNNITKANFVNLEASEGLGHSPLTRLQKDLFAIVNNYQDLYFHERTLRNGEEVRFVYCLHAVNHVLKTRLKVIHHNAKISRRDNVVSDEFRDQGLVRPKVLIVVPFKESALRVVKMIIEILLPDEKANVINKKRFFEEFSGNELIMPKKNPKPEDYEATFAGNTDDTFRLGITVTKKSLRLYADFYASDIIIASPLGLRVIVGAEGEPDRDFDFLASIEVLVLDQLEIFFMQNWDHLLHVLDHMHLQPRDSHGTDFSRVRSWAVNGWSRYYRQTLLFSSLQLPEFSALFNKKCHNYAGKVRAGNLITSGSICQVVVQLPQVFQKVGANSVAEAIESRFEFFTKKLLPQYKDGIMNHVLIFVPSYFDYVRLRNYLKREDMSFVQICEYSKDAKIARARDMFFHDDAHFLLYSERFHFFRRLRIKGIRHILYYQPPTFPHFYSEMCNLMHEANQNRHSGNDSNMTVTVLYTKYDVHQLAAIVGTERASRMISSDRSVHMFTTGGS